MRAKLLLAAVVLIGFVAPAVWADDITTFNVSGTFPAGLGTLSGTVTIDTTTGFFLNANSIIPAANADTSIGGDFTVTGPLGATNPIAPLFATLRHTPRLYPDC